MKRSYLIFHACLHFNSHEFVLNNFFYLLNPITSDSFWVKFSNCVINICEKLVVAQANGLIRVCKIETISHFDYLNDWFYSFINSFLLAPYTRSQITSREKIKK